jgi:hypothetical protein
MNKQYVKEVLNYYKDVLETDYYLDFIFDEKGRIEQSNKDCSELAYFFFGLKNQIDGKNIFINNLSSIFEKKQAKKYKISPSEILNLFYTPLMIQVNDDKDNLLNIAPFFIKIPIVDIENPFDNAQKVINVFLDTENNDSFEENIFYGNQIMINPAFFIEPFELLDISFLEVLDKLRRDNAKGNSIENMRQFAEYFLDVIKALKGNNEIDKSELEEGGQRSIIKNLRSIFERELNNILETKEINKNIVISDTPYFFAENLSKKKDNKMIQGLLKVYNYIEKADIDENNILSLLLKGNKYKYSPVPYEKVQNDNVTINMTPTLNNELSLKHYGSLSSEYDLTTSQKYCMNITNTNLPIIAFNGPPGTGKTSLLRAMIGNITAKNALRCYEEFLSRKDKFSFSIPLISYSTNNRALDNIVEGIYDAYNEIRTSLKDSDKILMESWIDPNFTFQYKNSDKKNMTIENNFNNIGLSVPIIKTVNSLNESNPDKPIFTTSLQTLNQLVSSVQNKPKLYIEEYMLKLNQFRRVCNDDFVKNRHLDALSQATKFLFQEINKTIKELNTCNQKLNRWLNSKVDVNELGLIQNISEKLNIEQQKTTTKIEYDFFITFVKDNIETIKESILNYHNEIDVLEQSYTKELDTLHKQYKDIEDNVYFEYEKSLFKINNDLNLFVTQNESYKNEQIKAVTKQYNEQIEKQQKLFTQNSFFKKLYMKILKEDKKEYKIIEDKFQNSINEIEKQYDDKIKNIEVSNENLLQEVQEKYTQSIKRYEEDKKSNIIFIQNNFQNTKKTIEQNFKDEFKLLGWSNSSISDINNTIIDIEVNINKLEIVDKFFYDEYEQKIKDIYQNADKELRTYIYLCSKHLLEGLFLYEVYSLNQSKISTQKCFGCGTKDSLNDPVENEKGNMTYKCKNCDFLFTNKDDDFHIKRKLSNSEIVRLFEDKYIYINNKGYTLKKEGTFWNIKPYVNISQNSSNSSMPQEQMLRYLSIFFPIVNTTCHSFGNVLPIKESYIENMLIDEAGMILSPYAVNIYTAKRVFVFGDEKQIEPVYPLGVKGKSSKKDEDNPTEYKTKKEEINGYLLKKHISKPNIVKVKEFASVLNSSIMSLANKSVYIKNPYIQHTLDGDLWLMEHFRCRDNIIDFCNQEIYNGIMNLQKGNNNQECHFDFIETTIDAQSKDGSKYNTHEANEIINHIKQRLIYCKTLDEKKEILKNIGIISPFKQQEYELNKIIKRENLDGLVAGTVHKFQGSEREIIYFSTTVGETNSCANSFYNNEEKPNIINVAISRAKEKFIIVGNRAKLAEDTQSLTGKLIKYIDTINSNCINNSKF